MEDTERPGHFSELVHDAEQAARAEPEPIVEDEPALTEEQAPELQVEEPAPPPEPVSGTGLLETYLQHARHFVVLPDEEAYDVLALWCLYTYAWREFRYTPYLRLSSPEMRSGKTRVIETCIEPWAAQPVKSVGGTTAAYIRRAVAAWHPVFIVDESDGWSSDPEKAETIRGILNQGYARGKPYGMVAPSGEPVELDVYCPKVIAGIGRLPDTVEDRSIKIPMRRKRPDQTVWPWESDTADMLERSAARWRDQARQWTTANVQQVRRVRPVYPESVFDRVRDTWRPLFHVATAIGGEWPERVRAAAEALERPRAELERDSVANLVLHDLRDEFAGREFMTTNDALLCLERQTDRPWTDWKNGMTGHQLAKILKPYGLKPELRSINGVNCRGYDGLTFADAWVRYL